MRVIAIKTLRLYWQIRPETEQAIKTWYEDVKDSNWKSPQELKEKYRNASIINSKRVVFNIKGNDFRLLVNIEYALGLIFVIWIGTHKEYDKIDAKTIHYAKTGENRKRK